MSMLGFSAWCLLRLVYSVALALKHNGVNLLFLA